MRINCIRKKKYIKRYIVIMIAMKKKKKSIFMGGFRSRGPKVSLKLNIYPINYD